MNIIEEYQQIVGPAPSMYASQDELDQIGLLLDRLEELEIYFNAPSITRDQKQDTWTEMETVMDRMNLLMEKV